MLVIISFHKEVESLRVMLVMLKCNIETHCLLKENI